MKPNWTFAWCAVAAFGFLMIAYGLFLLGLR